MANTIGSAPQRIGAGYAGGAPATGRVGANNAAGYYGQGAGTTGQVANGFNNFVQGGNQLGFQSGGDSAPVNSMPKPAKPPKAAKPPTNQKTEQSNEAEKKEPPRVFDEDDDGGGGGEEE